MTPTIEVEELALQDTLELNFEEIQKRLHKTDAELQAAVEKNQLLEQTRAFIAHEFRNAIVPLSVNAQMLAEELAKPDSNKEKLGNLAQRIIKQSHAAGNIVDEYVDYSRPLNPNFELVNIGDILNQVQEEYTAEYKKRNIEILYDKKSAVVAVDKQMMAQVFRNLLNNTLEAIEECGFLTITVFVHDGIVGVVFRDTGPGFPDEYLSRAFAFGVTTRFGKRGAGIGLALSQRLVQANRGDITINNWPSWPLREVSGALVIIALPNPQSEQIPTTGESVVLRENGK